MTDQTTTTWFQWAEKHLEDWKSRLAELSKPFTADALEVIDNAVLTADSLKHKSVRAEHLLAGLLDSRHANVRRLIRASGLDLPGLRKEIDAILTDPNAHRSLSRPPHLCRIVEVAKKEAEACGEDLVGAGHLLLGLLRERNGLPARILKQFPIDLERARFAVLQENRNDWAHMQMNERETYESIKREIKKTIETMRAKSPEAAEYLEKHLVMDDVKMTFMYTGDDRLRLKRMFQ